MSTTRERAIKAVLILMSYVSALAGAHVFFVKFMGGHWEGFQLYQLGFVQSLWEAIGYTRQAFLMLLVVMLVIVPIAVTYMTAKSKVIGWIIKYIPLIFFGLALEDVTRSYGYGWQVDLLFVLNMIFYFSTFILIILYNQQMVSEK
ncbi:hypothetical protein [Hahella ganghwensis]|uniref:hypothetical protein n=1 Tax=Hahella ganghwensis TaxID=286420 RepID=UPI00037D9184|nr:hypothetical protein [Hahella ganghwensis]